VSAQSDTPTGRALVRIGELSRRTGVGVDTLRAWERRYGLLHPERSPGGFRLYRPGDEARVRSMKSLIDSGVSAAQAARIASSEGRRVDGPGREVDDSATRLWAVLERFEEVDANAILDDALARFTIDAVIRRIILPLLQEIGNGWEAGQISVAQEHFAAGVLRGRMLALGRNWGAGRGPLAVLACPPGEQHDLGLIAFGLVLRERGWRITFLGSDTPIETIVDAAAKLEPAAVVLAAVSREPFETVAREIRDLGHDIPVLIGGEGASKQLAERLRVRALESDPVVAAAAMPTSV
jgi:MerR family transcriptional regulator, light-induced transcriptional regulator